MAAPSLFSTIVLMAVFVSILAPSADCHSSLISPAARNAIDRSLYPWNHPNWGPGTLPNNATCIHPSTENSTTQKRGRCWGCTCVNGTEPCNVAQTCVWFSQGCSIGCPSCDGLESNPNKVDRCKCGMKPTNNDPYYRTYNRDVPAMSSGDWTQHNPWRAPGSAPVMDACGMAGGGPKWISTQLSYVDTLNAKQGDLGSKVLPRSPTGVVWKKGDVVEAKWAVRANHGGGYQYRLCSAHSTLSEECLQLTPVPFVGKTFLEWGNGSRLEIEGRYLSHGTKPVNSTWAMMPLPYSDGRTHSQFDTPCDETVNRVLNDTGKCSGRFPWDVSIIDQLRVPDNIVAGEYVLGFRWDCEATAQVWSSCADIEISD